MRRLVWLAAVATLLVSNVGGAAAQLGDGEPTSLEPLTELIDALGAGTAGDAVVSAGDGPIVSQFQVAVNLGDSPTFYERDIEVDPVGFDGSGQIVDLAPFLGANLEYTRQIPPIHPGGSVVDIGGQDRFDLASVFPGWEAFGEFGPIDGPVPAIPTNTMIWGFELAQPFDTSCATAQAVGRAWESESLVSANAPFTAAGLDEWWPGTHGALADGTLGRFIQLNCYAGSQPAIETMRMNPDLGRIRPFGPLEIVALVSGNFVVFVGALTETEDHARDVTFFATGASGAVETIAGSGPIPVLLPNPYDVVPQRIDFIYDVGSIERIGTDGESVTDRGLLADPIRSAPIAASGRTTHVGLSCSLGLVSLFKAEDQVGLGVWSPQESVWRNGVWDGEWFQSEQVNSDGTSDLLIFRLDEKTFEISIFGTEDGDCRVRGTIELSGAGCTVDCDGTAAPASPAPADECVGDDCGVDPSTAKCEGAACPDASAGTGDSSGTPWAQYGVGAAGVGAIAYGAYRAIGRREEALSEHEAATRPRDAAGAFVVHPNLTWRPQDWPAGSELIRRDDGTQMVIVPEGSDPLADQPDRWTIGPDYSHPAFGMTEDELSGHVFESGNVPDASAAPADHVLEVREDGTSVFVPQTDQDEEPEETLEPDAVGEVEWEDEERHDVNVQLPGGAVVNVEGTDPSAGSPEPDFTPVIDGNAGDPARRPDARTWTTEEASRWFAQAFDQVSRGVSGEDGVVMAQSGERLRIMSGAKEAVDVQVRSGPDQEWRLATKQELATGPLAEVEEVFETLKGLGQGVGHSGSGDSQFEFERLGYEQQQRLIDAMHELGLPGPPSS